MWINTPKGYVNLDYVARIQLTGKYINIYQQDNKDLIAQLPFASEEAARDEYKQLDDNLTVFLRPIEERKVGAF